MAELLVNTAVTGLSTVAFYPLERVKVVYSCQDYVRNGRKYSGWFDTGRQIWRHEGYLGLFRGLDCKLMEKLVVPRANQAFMETLLAILPEPNPTSPFLFYMIRKQGLATVSEIAWSTTEYAKTIKTVNYDIDRPLDQIFQKGFGSGFKKICDDILLVMIGSFVYKSLYYGVYEAFRPFIFDESDNQGIVFLKRFLLGFCVRSFGNFVVYPIRMFRRKLAIKNESNHEDDREWHTMGLLGKLKATLQEGGIRSLYRGYPQELMESILSVLLMISYDAFRSSS